MIGDVPEMGVHGYPEIQGPPTLVHGLGVAPTARAQAIPAVVVAPERGR